MSENWQHRVTHSSRQEPSERLKAMLRPLIPLRYRPQAFFDRWIGRRAGDVVRGGPFEGMLYIDEAREQIRLLPRLLGTYELELWEPLRQAIDHGYPRVVNVGAGEGYYVVGLARAIPGARIVAFEDNAQRRDLVAKMAAHNGVAERVEVHGRCEADDLQVAVEQPGECLLVMDVEGAEIVLLDPAVAPGLERCAILVEIHDFVDQNLSATIRSRFEATHDIIEIEQRARTHADFPLDMPLGDGGAFSRRYTKSMDEGRPAQMSWFWMTPVSTRPA